jgi:hypothetical protein
MTLDHPNVLKVIAGSAVLESAGNSEMRKNHQSQVL